MEVLIVEDHHSVAKGVETYIQAQWPEVKIFTASKIQDSLYLLVANPNINLVVIDLELSGDQWGIDLVKRIQEESRKVKIVIHTKYDELSYLNQSLKYGANAYTVKTISEVDFIDCLKSVISTGRTISVSEKEIRQLGENIFSQVMLTPTEKFITLTKAERKVLPLAILDHSREQIGFELKIGVATVKTHLKKINIKLGTKNRAELRVFMKLNPQLMSHSE